MERQRLTLIAGCALLLLVSAPGCRGLRKRELPPERPYMMEPVNPAPAVGFSSAPAPNALGDGAGLPMAGVPEQPVGFGGAPTGGERNGDVYVPAPDALQPVPVEPAPIAPATAPVGIPLSPG